MTAVSKEHLDKYDLIYKDYPETFKWMQHKAGWEHMSLMAVLDGYESYIDELMEKESSENTVSTKEESK